MATVRIFKIAELLGTTSQEVTALLKRDHGIEVKSASSTIEEVVGRQFVERLARQRNISLPGGDMFAETPAPKGKKGAPAKKPVEPVPSLEGRGQHKGHLVGADLFRPFLAQRLQPVGTDHVPQHSADMMRK